MGQPPITAKCAKADKAPESGSTDPASGCATDMGEHRPALSTTPHFAVYGSGQNSITIIDKSWGVPGLGTDGTLAMGGMAIAAATVTIIAWRALAPGKL